MKVARWVASGFGAGFSPWAPGTAGSLVGLAIGAALLHFSSWWLAAGVVLAVAAGMWAIPAATGMRWRGGAAGEPDDPGWIVIDEIAGQMLTLLAASRPSWWALGLAFGLFRLFDIWKPGPVGWMDRRGGALGGMGDDLLAGMIGFECLFTVVWLVG